MSTENNLKKVITAVAFCLLLASSALAQTRVGTVNLMALFNQYWKTGLIRTALKAKAKELDHTDRQMIAGLKKARDKYRKLCDESANQALSPAQSAKYQREAADQLERVREMEDNIATFEQQASATLAEQKARARKDLLADISAAVAGVAKAKGYSLVVDAETQAGDADSSDPDFPPVVLYSAGSNDLTQSVLAQLNAGAPVDTSTTGSGLPTPGANE